MVYLETKAHFGPKWWEEAKAALDRSGAPGIPADKSLARDKKHPHISTPESDPLWFLSFGSFLKIIFDDTVSVEYSYRPSATAATGFPERGSLYHFTFSQTAQSNRHLDYREILNDSEGHHSKVAYLVLNSFQQQLKVSVPAIYPAEEILRVADDFFRLCGNCFAHSYREQTEKQFPLPEEGSFSSMELGEILAKQYEAVDSAFTEFAARWPHYVVPPGNPLAFLDSSMPCRFFEA